MFRNIIIKFENEHIFKENKNNEMVSKTIFNVKTIEKSDYNNSYKVSENIKSQTTIRTILEFPSDKKIIALNFANAMCPGGGYIIGGNAQEESLCRASLLYYTIRTQKAFYRKNRFHFLPDYTDTMIYSENVPIIRNDNGEFLETPAKCSFLTCPAVNYRFGRFIFSDKRLIEKMTIRIDKIIRFIVSENPDVIVLGAFGCGAFGNDKKTILEIFENVINKYTLNKIEIIFAIP